MTQPPADSLARAKVAVTEWHYIDPEGYERCKDDCSGPELHLSNLENHVARAIDEAVAAEHVFTASWADKCLMLERALAAERKRAQDVVEALGHTKIADAAAGSSGPQ